MIYKCDVIHHIVVVGHDEAEALEAVKAHTELDGVSREICPLQPVQSLEDLEQGWDELAIPFSVRNECNERIGELLGVDPKEESIDVAH